MSEPIITVPLDINMVQRLRLMSLKYEDIPDDVARFVDQIEEDVLSRPAKDIRVMAWKMKTLGGDMLDFMLSKKMVSALDILMDDIEKLRPSLEELP